MDFDTVNGSPLWLALQIRGDVQKIDSTLEQKSAQGSFEIWTSLKCIYSYLKCVDMKDNF